MSGAQTSPWLSTNELLAPMAAYDTHTNQLLQQQERQQGIAANNTEVVARAASTLLDPTLYPTEEARAAAWPDIIGQLKANGYAPNAPETYPGLDHLKATAQLGISTIDRYKLGLTTAPGSQAAIDRLNQIYTGGVTPPATTSTGSGTGAAAPATGGDGLTGDKAHDLPLIAQRESGGSPTVLNYVAQQDPTAYARGATASGKYQIVNSTWREGMQLAGLDPAQYATARDAPEPVQDKVASALYDKYGNAPWKKGATDWVKDEQGRYQMATVRPPAGAPGGTPSVAAPGGSTASAAPPGVQMGGAAPPPPGGALGAYPAKGAGVGDVIGGQPAAARATIPAGRPTGPPVITDQPAGSNVVAGPPGVATVGAPQPPSPAVPGNVAAINAGIVGRGGQPVTDPDATPTPARYAGTAPAPPVEAAPQAGWGSTVGQYSPTNAIMPPPNVQPPGATVAAAPAPQQPPAAALPPAARANLPRAADVPSGMNSPQVQQAQDLMRRAAQIEMVAAQNPYDQRLKATAAAQAADLKQRAQVLMQTDNVVQTQDGQLHVLTGVIDKPVPHFVWDEKQGAYVDTTGSTAPVTPPSPRLLNVEGVGVVQSKPGGGATLVVPQNTAGITAAEASKALGKATGTDVAKQVPQYMQIGQRADQAINVIDSGIQHLSEAAKGNIPSGYFAPWLATGAAAMKSLGVDLTTLGIDPKAVGDVQTAQKTLGIVSGAILQNTLGKDSQITDAKIEHFIHTQPDLAMDPNALSRILQWARTQFVFEHDMAIDAMKTAATSPSGTLPLNWAPGYFAAKGGFGPIYNPLTGQSTLPTGEGVPREPPASQPAGGTIIRYDARGKRLP